MMSRERLLQLAREQDYKPEVLEKVYRLLETLSQIAKIPFLKDRLVLKGGTALNLFCFNEVPRLSVDIDLNYIGSVDREVMLEERVIINDAISELLLKNQFVLYRNPGHHAGGKMVWRYPSVFGQFGNLEIDLNYMYRQPLFEPKIAKPYITHVADISFPVLDIHELAAGKLSALMTRTASRDLFDAYYLLTKSKLDHQKLRLAFVVYMAMTELPLDQISVVQIDYDLKELNNRLLPVLQQGSFPTTRGKLASWSGDMVQSLKSALGVLMPLNENENQFIQALRENGVIQPELISPDKNMQARIKKHPALQWAIKKSAGG